MESQDKKEVEKMIQLAIKTSFKKKIGDTPTDDLQLTNRKYVNLNGTTTNRPTSSVTGQQYFDTTIGRPVFWTGTTWKDAAGSIS